MADSTSVALEAAPIPTADDVERAAAFTHEPFVLEGENAATALAPGSARRRALDAALAELDAGARAPSIAWRQRWSLLLGLDRLLSQDDPRLADGTLLSAHQVDALSGTLTALLAEAQRNAEANGTAALDVPTMLASSGIPGEEDLEDDDEPEEPQDWEDEPEPAEAAADEIEEQPEDPNAAKRFWFEHATGAGKTVAALGFVEASRTGGTLILTHRRNLVDQFLGELRDRGYAKRIAPPLLRGQDRADGPVTVETYQWFVRNAGEVSDAYTIVICDEAHTALGEKTSAAIRRWAGPVFIGMTATGALIARHVTDLFPTQTSRFDLAQAARRGVISPLRCVRIPPGPGVRTIAKVPLRRGEVDTEFDQEMLAELLDQLPFNLAIADLYKTRFNGVPGVVYAAGVRHAYNVAEAFRNVGMKAQAVSGETPKRELAQILARYEKGDVDVLVNAQLLAEGWNSPRATVCMHLAPTASRRIYQQRVGRVTRRQPGKEAGIVVDFVHPATKHDDPVVTLHSLLDREVYRGGAIVVGPVRRGRGRRLRVERRVLPVTADENRRIEVFERELWRIAVEHLDYGEQVQWAALAGARVAPAGWRRARAMLHFDQGGELKRAFLLTAVERNKNPQLRLRALQEVAASRDAEAFDRALDFVEGWPREEKREGVKTVLLALADKKIGRRDQANNWIWRCANMTREVHEEYAVQRWPETKRLLGLLVNSSGSAHARNARRLVHAARQQDRRLSAALLAAAIPHTAEAGEVINGARTRMSRKPAALARELLRNFPKGRTRRTTRRRRRKGLAEGMAPEAMALEAVALDALDDGAGLEADEAELDEVAAAVAADEIAETEDDSAEVEEAPRPRRRRRTATPAAEAPAEGEEAAVPAETAAEAPRPRRRRRVVLADVEEAGEPVAATAESATEAPTSRRARRAAKPAEVAEGADAVEAPRPRRTRRTAKPAEPAVAEVATEVAEPAAEAPKPRRTRRTAKPAEAPAVVEAAAAAEAAEAPKPPRARRATRTVDQPATAEAAPAGDAVEATADAPKPRRTRRTAKAARPAASEPAAAAEPQAADAAAEEATAVADAAAEAPKPRRTRRTTRAAEPPATATAAEAAEATEPPAAAEPSASAAAEAAEATEPPAAAEPSASAAAEVADAAAAPKPRRTRRAAAAAAPAVATVAAEAAEPSAAAPKPRRTRRPAKPAETAAVPDASKSMPAEAEAAKPAQPAAVPEAPEPVAAEAEPAKPRRTRRAATPPSAAPAEAADPPKPARTRRTAKASEPESPLIAAAAAVEAAAEAAPKPRRRRSAATADGEETKPAAPRRRSAKDPDDGPVPADEAA